jgi:hypothetical protein
MWKHSLPVHVRILDSRNLTLLDYTIDIWKQFILIVKKTNGSGKCKELIDFSTPFTWVLNMVVFLVFWRKSCTLQKRFSLKGLFSKFNNDVHRSKHFQLRFLRAVWQIIFKSLVIMNYYCSCAVKTVGPLQTQSMRNYHSWITDYKSHWRMSYS